MVLSFLQQRTWVRFFHFARVSSLLVKYLLLIKGRMENAAAADTGSGGCRPLLLYRDAVCLPVRSIDPS